MSTSMLTRVIPVAYFINMSVNSTIQTKAMKGQGFLNKSGREIVKDQGFRK